MLFLELKEFGSRGPGTNYINASHESKAERSFEAVILAMAVSDWMMVLYKKISLADAKVIFLQIGL